VLVEMTWGGNPVPSKRMVNLVRVDGEWRIDQVTMAD
jgi:hypothetical protein